jgi:choline-sulfatase
VTSCPLTLPAHASLLTGLEPPAHGLRDNGAGALPADLPTLAETLARRGYRTAAFVGSRVLDRRFGLARGFAIYDDRMAAEQLSAQGDPERDADAVTDAALAWLRADAEPAAGGDRARLLWIHYYDPHAPYVPPGLSPAASDQIRYAGEVAHVDRELGRLLAALPGGAESWLVAAVGDHGEAFDEHGERGHGVLLHRETLEVPLVVAGPGVARGRVVDAPVPTRALASSLLALLGRKEEAKAFGEGLPALGADDSSASSVPIYSETWLPATAYGWSELRALTTTSFRYIAAPRPELYDLAADRDERRNLAPEQPALARRLARELDQLATAGGRREPAPLPADDELRDALASLGYLSGASGAGTDAGRPRRPERTPRLDPKDGLPLLERYEAAKRLLAAENPTAARGELEALVRANPENVPFVTALGAVLLGAGEGERALAAYRRAVELNPGADFAHANLGKAFASLGRADEARRALGAALERNPRLARAWLALAELEQRRGHADGERKLLEQAVRAGTDSAGILTRLAQIEMAAGELALAGGHLEEATSLRPGWAAGWLVRGELERARGDRAAARNFFLRAIEAEPDSEAASLARRFLLR